MLRRIAQNRTCHGLLATCSVVLLWVNQAAAQSRTADSVEQLRQVLRGPVSDPAGRDKATKSLLSAFQEINELHRALVLHEWRDLDAEDSVAAVDRSNREVVARRYESAVRSLLAQPDAATRLAVLRMIAEMGVSVRDVGSKKPYGSVFCADLVAIMHRGDAGLMEAAADALSKIHPDPNSAVAVFGDLLHSSNHAKKLVGAKSLVNLIRVAASLNDRNQSPVAAQLSAKELVETGQAVVRAAGQGMRDRDAQVRRSCLEAIAQTAATFRRLVEAAFAHEGGEDRWEPAGRSHDEQTALLPLIAALGEQGPMLTKALADSDASVRAVARQALEDLTNPQLHLIFGRVHDASAPEHEIASAVQPAAGAGPGSSRDPFVESFHGTVVALAQGLDDPDHQVRKAALDLLETLGPVASSAAPALAKALTDPDKFVRWAATRTLGKMSPASQETVVPGLARLLSDPDLDLQLAAALALERYASAAKPAVPALIKVLGEEETRRVSGSENVQTKVWTEGDPRLRVAAIRALEAIGSRGLEPALDALCSELRHPDARVRQQAAEALGRIDPAPSKARDALREALQDEAPEVQKAASDALLHLAQHSRK